MTPLPSDAVISVVIPVYNEIRTLAELLRRLVAVDFPKELVLVDDGSRDGSRELLERIGRDGVSALEGARPVNRNDVKIVLQPHNQGKGAALQRGFSEASGAVVIVQDADLEYDPKDILKVVAPIREGLADVVFGSRFIGERRRALYFWHAVINKGLTTLSNMTSGLNLTDMETCYKAFRREVLRTLVLEERRFGIEPELTAKIGAGGHRVYEVPISYFGRTYEEGKKIGWKDGVRAVYAIGKYGVWRRVAPGNSLRETN